MLTRFAPLRRIALGLTVLAIGAIATACGKNGESDAVARFTVEIVTPAEGDVLYTDVPTTLGAEIVPEGDFDPDAVDFVFDWSFGGGASSIGATARVEHAFATPGQTDVTVIARQIDGERTVAEAMASRSLAINPAADLALDTPTLTLSSAVVRSGDAFRVSVNLLNLAARVPGEFDIGIYAGTPDVIDPDAPLSSADLRAFITSGAVAELAVHRFDAFDAQPAQALIDDQTLTPPDTLDSGEYVIFVYADPADVVGERDEDNNVAFAARRLPVVNSTGEGPDLLVRGVSARPLRANVLNNLTVTATLENAGNAFAEPFDYEIWLSADNPTIEDFDRLLTSARIDNIPVGGTFDIRDVVLPLDPPVTELGNYFVVVTADTGDEVTEINETNNTSASARLVVTDEPVPGVDIVPAAFQVLPDTTFLGGSIQVDLTVANEGTAPVETQFNCKVYFSLDEIFDIASDQLVTTMLFNGLNDGESTTVQVDAFVPGFLEPGDYWPIAACDPSLLVPESDDDNNVIANEGTVLVATDANVDMRPEALVVDPMEVENEGSVSVSVDICNDGSNGSTPSVVRVFMSEDPIVDLTDSVLVESRVPPINPGACVTILADVPASCDTFVSDYTIFAVADVTGLVAEADEENNVIRLDDDFTISGLICDCELDRFEPNDSPATASFLNPDVGSYTDLTMCERAFDYYLLPLLDDETVRVTIDFDGDRGNLDMELFALDFSTVLDRSETDGDREEVSFIRVPQRGNYLLRVKGRTEDDRNVYALDLAVSSPEPGSDLIVLDVEVSDPRPALGATIEACFDLVNLGDTPVGSTLTRIYLSEDPQIDPVEDLLLGDLGIDGFEDRVTRCVDVTLPDDVSGGERYLGVVADARDDVPGEFDEDNNDGVSPVFFLDDECFDVLEPNNDLETPRPLELFGEPPILFSELLVCSDNRDFYEICLEDGDFLDVVAAFDPADGDVDLKLYDDDGDEVDRSEGIGNEERVAVDFVAGDRCYTVEIYVAGRDREVPYSLTVNTGRAPEELTCSRIEEPNEGFGTAVALRNHLDDCMAVCPNADDDYYQVQLSPGTDLTIRLVGPDEGAPSEELRMALWGPARNFLTNTVTADEPLTYRIPVAGRHYLRVRSNGSGPRNQPYCFVVEGLSGTDLVPTDFELDTDVTRPGETVRFSFTLSNTRDEESEATNYAVFLSTDPVLSEDDTLLREVPLEPLAGLADRVEGRRFEVPADLVDGGSHHVILFVDADDDIAELSEANNIAHQPLFVSPRCTPDEAEPNNFPIDAAPATEVEGAALTSCGEGDDDWYSFTATRPLTEIQITFSDADGDLDLHVYDTDLGLVDFSDSITDDEYVSLLTSAGEEYLVLVRQHTDRTPRYTLTIE